MLRVNRAEKTENRRVFETRQQPAVDKCAKSSEKKHACMYHAIIVIVTEGEKTDNKRGKKKKKRRLGSIECVRVIIQQSKSRWERR